MLTFLGLVINTIAACLLRICPGAINANRMFFYAGLIIIGAGIFDMVDGRVARQDQPGVGVWRVLRLGDRPLLRRGDFFGLLIFLRAGSNRLFFTWGWWRL